MKSQKIAEQLIESRNITHVFDTHVHADHRSGARWLVHMTGAKYCMHRSADVAFAFERLDDGQVIELGNTIVKVLHTPGHTPGSQCFRVKNALVSGDTLFIQGCGRVDLPGSDPDEMFNSLHKLAALPDDTVLYPGHDYGGGPHRTMAETKRINAYLRIPNIEMWRELMGS